MPTPDICIENLIQQLHSRDWTARCDAARLLGQSRDPRAVAALLPDLHDPDWRVRRNAAQALGALRDPRAVEPLIQTLKDKTMTVRQRAIVALGRIQDLQALPALLHSLLEDKQTSYEASRAISKFGKKALPEIARMYAANNHRQLLMLLIEMKYEGVFDLILSLLHSPESSTRLMAIQELGKLGNKNAVPHLIAQLNSNNAMLQSEAVRALGRLDAQETIPTLLNLLADDELYGPRSGTYHAVTEAFQTFARITDEIENAFPGNYPAMFNVAGAPISLPEAMGLLGNDQSQVLNEALGKLRSDRAEPVRIPGLSSDAMSKVVEDMAWKFGIMFADAQDARQDRLKRLLEILKSESSLARSAAALTLPWYPDERSLDALEQATRDAAETVRRTATWARQALQKTLSYRRQLGL